MADQLVDLQQGMREYDELRLAQVCQALGEPFESPADHPGEPPYRMDWPRILNIMRSRTRAWTTLLRHAEEHDPEWLAEWRRQPSVTDPTKRWVWNPMSQSYGPPPPGDADGRH